MRRAVPGRTAQLDAGLCGPARARATAPASRCPASRCPAASRDNRTPAAGQAGELGAASKTGAAGTIGTAGPARRTRSDNVATYEVGGHHGQAGAPPGPRDVPRHVPGHGRLAGVALDGAAAVHGGQDVPGRGSGPRRPVPDPGRASRPGPGEGHRGHRRGPDPDDSRGASPGGKRTLPLRVPVRLTHPAGPAARQGRRQGRHRPLREGSPGDQRPGARGKARRHPGHDRERRLNPGRKPRDGRSRPGRRAAQATRDDGPP